MNIGNRTTWTCGTCRIMWRYHNVQAMAFKLLLPAALSAGQRAGHSFTQRYIVEAHQEKMSAWRQKVFLFWKSHRQVEQTASDCYWSKDVEWLQEGTRENAEDWDGLLHGPLVRQVHTATSSPQDPGVATPGKLQGKLQKWVFRSTGATRCTTNVKCCMRLLPVTIFLRLSVQKCGITAAETVKIWNFAHKIAPKGQIVFTNFTKLSAIVLIYYRWPLYLVTFGGQTDMFQRFTLDCGIFALMFNSPWRRNYWSHRTHSRNGRVTEVQKFRKLLHTNYSWKRK